MWPDPLRQRPAGGNGHLNWPEVVTALAALGTLAYLISQDTNQWFYLVIRGTLTVITLILVVRSLGFFDKLRAIRSVARTNKLARKYFPEYLRLLRKKSAVYRELLRILREVEWTEQDAKPRMANYSFENMQQNILGMAESIREITTVKELQFISARFYDFLELFNYEFLDMHANALRTGRAKLKYEYQAPLLRQYKEQYDRFLEEYTDFCERFNESARHNYLTPVFRLPPSFD